MVNFRQVLFSLLRWYIPVDELAPPHVGKQIAIVGAGSAGLAMLKTLLDLPETTRETWNIVLFDQRHGLGGIWLPDPDPAPPPSIPETALYPLLRTNTPVPSMSYPHFPFLRDTPLYPSHEYIEAYHARYAKHYNITQHIRFKHEVLKTSWTGSPTNGHWDITYRDNRGVTRHGDFDHLVVATGNNHIPRIPTWPGQQDWLANSPNWGPKREILHSAWYRGPERYTGLRVLIVGAGSSGRDTTRQIVPLANSTFVSLRHEPDPIIGPVPEGAQIKPDILRFTARGVVFRDGTSLDVDAVLLATGFELRKPFLEKGGLLVTDHRASNRSRSSLLVTNTRYIFPLHRHIFSLAPSYPVNALAFIGLPSAIPNCPSDIAESLFATHVILNSSILPSRDELLKDLAEKEDVLWRAGYDPYSLGHQMPVNTSNDYQDALVDYLKEKGALPNDGQKFVEQWRRDTTSYKYLMEGWKRIESLGTWREWLEGVETEAQWASLMERVNRWEEEWEISHGIPFKADWDMVV